MAAGSDNAAARVCMDELRPEDVQRALQRLKPKRSSGPDGIPPYIFKDCRYILWEPLLYIYNKLIQTAVFPPRWKTTRVVPVPTGKRRIAG